MLINGGMQLNDLFLRERYVCVEPGYVRGFVKLAPGETWSGHQVITVTDGQASKI